MKRFCKILFILISFTIFVYTVYALGSWTVGYGGDTWTGNASFINTTKNNDGNVVLNYSNWWNYSWNYRILIIVNSTGYERINYPIEYTMNFTQELSNCTGTCGFDNNSVRIVEYNETGDILYELPSQFEQASGYNNQTNAVGEVVWLLNGTTPSNTKRYYFVYFDTAVNPKSAPNYSPSFTTTYNASSNITVTYNGSIVAVVDIKTGGTRAFSCSDSAADLLQLNTLNGTTSIDPTVDWIISDEYLNASGCAGGGGIEPYALQEYSITSGPVRTKIFTRFNSSAVPPTINFYNFTWTFYSGESTELKGRFNWTIDVNTPFSFGAADWPRQLGVHQNSVRYKNYSTGNTTGTMPCAQKVDAQDRYDSVFNDTGFYPTISFVTTQTTWSTMDLNNCACCGQNYQFGHAINGYGMIYSGIMNNLWWFHIYPGVFNNTKTSAFSNSVMNPANITKGSTELNRFFSSGNLTSIVKDAGSGHGWKTIRFQGTLPDGTNVSLYFNSSSDNGTSDPYSGWVEVQLAATNNTTYNISSANQERYGSWRLWLQTNNISITPMIYNVTIDYLSLDGSSCSLAAECLGGNCVHGICRSAPTYCGDGYCDSGEICDQECGGGSVVSRYIKSIPSPKTCPECLSPSEWSECSDNEQTRIFWYCNSTSRFGCGNYTENRSCSVPKPPEVVESQKEVGLPEEKVEVPVASFIEVYVLIVVSITVFVLLFVYQKFIL